MRKFISQEDMRRANLLEIFGIIRNEGALTRKRLQELSGLSWGGVSQIVSRLIELSYVSEKKADDGVSSGRTPSVVFVNSCDNYMVGIDINESGLYAVIINMCNEIIFEASAKADFSGKGALLSSVYGLIDIVLSKCEDKNVLGIGVSMQGAVDVNKGLSISVPNCPDWKNVEIERLLSEKYSLPVFMAHDPDCLLFAAAYNDKHEDTVLLRIDDGIGMAVMKNKKLISGLGMLEIGDTLVNPNREADIKNGSLSHYATLSGDKSDEFFSDMAFYLGTAITNAVVMFNVKKIYICGAMLNYKSQFLEMLCNTVTHQLCGKQAEILEFDVNKAAYGAALIAINRQLSYL